MQIRERLVKQLIAFIKALDELVPKGGRALADPPKALKAMLEAFTDLCQVVAIELTYCEALKSDLVRPAAASARLRCARTP